MVYRRPSPATLNQNVGSEHNNWRLDLRLAEGLPNRQVVFDADDVLDVARVIERACLFGLTVHAPVRAEVVQAPVACLHALDACGESHSG